MRIDADRWLCAMIAPTQRTFSLRERITDHGRPDVDLEQLERAELMERMPR